MRIDEKDLKQSSPEWHEARRLRIGSSEISTVCGVNPYESKFELWLRKTGKIPPKDLSGNYHVQRGTELEPIARYMVNNELCAEFHPCVFRHEEIDYIIYSSDGYDANRNEIIEIKCMGQKNHKLVLDTNEIIPYYRPQVMWGMELSKTELCHFVVYNPSHHIPYKRIEIKSDKAYQDYLLVEADIFWESVLKDIPPEPTEKDKILFKEYFP